MNGRPPLAYASRGADQHHLSALSATLPEDLVERVKSRASLTGLTVDQFVTLALALVLPRMIEGVIHHRVENAGRSVQWPTRWVDETADPVNTNNVAHPWDTS